MKHIKIQFAVMFIILLNFSQQAISTNVASNVTSDALMQKEILYHINEYRTKHHLSALHMNHVISQEATQHSLEMARHKIPFGHDKFNQRMSRLYKSIKKSNGGAENVAYNYKNAKIVVQQWLLSPGHLHNIRGNYNLTGIGVARDERGRIYYTQMFVRTA